MSPLLALTVLGLSTAAGVIAQRGNQTTINFQACPELNANISALLGLSITPFECATLEVPLDYTNPQSGPLDLSLFRVNATEEPVLGTVLINFGGPGGTGAENLPVLADLAHKIIGPQWNLVSWDPRGTGYTIPFACDLETVAPTPARKRELGTLVSTNLTEVFLNGGWELAGEIATFCAQSAAETGELIGTVFTARDMMAIVDALGEDGLLRYYGWSYGTALGSYAAAMFPDRIERMVLDANVNPHDYAAGHYGEFVEDIDKALDGFLQTCFDTKDACALYTLLQPKSAEDLLDALNLVLTPFAENATTDATAYSLYAAVKGILVQPLYFPATWPSFAATLAGLLNGTTSPAENTTAAPVYGDAVNAVIGIRASDATFIANSSDQYLPQVRYQATVSPGFSDIAYFSIWASARWAMPAKERYFGDFRAATKTPILYVNGEFDPVTPLVNAYNGSAGFQGSVVLPHSGYGHGVFASPSECVARHVRAYFLNATLPPSDEHCDPDATLTQTWLATVQGSASNSSSVGAGNNTGSGDSSGNGNDSSTAAPSGNAAASRETSSYALYTIATVLALTTLILL